MLADNQGIVSTDLLARRTPAGTLELIPSQGVSITEYTASFFEEHDAQGLTPNQHAHAQRTEYSAVNQIVLESLASSSTPIATLVADYYAANSLTAAAESLKSLTYRISTMPKAEWEALTPQQRIEIAEIYEATFLSDDLNVGLFMTPAAAIRLSTIPRSSASEIPLSQDIVTWFNSNGWSPGRERYLQFVLGIDLAYQQEAMPLANRFYDVIQQSGALEVQGLPPHPQGIQAQNMDAVQQALEMGFNALLSAFGLGNTLISLKMDPNSDEDCSNVVNPATGEIKMTLNLAISDFTMREAFRTLAHEFTHVLQEVYYRQNNFDYGVGGQRAYIDLGGWGPLTATADAAERYLRHLGFQDKFSAKSYFYSWPEVHAFLVELRSALPPVR